VNHRQAFKATENFWEELYFKVDADCESAAREESGREDIDSMAFVSTYERHLGSQPSKRTTLLLSPAWLARVISDNMDTWEDWGREGAPFVRVGRRLHEEALTGKRVVGKRSSSPRRKIQTQAPTWAKTLVRKVCREEGLAQPRMTWRGGGKKRGRKRDVTGWATLDRDLAIPGWGVPLRIHIKARERSTRLEQKLVVLHELAHCIASIEAMHNQKFWEVCWRLYRRHGIPVKYAIDREYHGAKVAYRKIQRAKRKPVEMEVVA
tara:strand:+ start:2202 stop:2993 length:792 start_codon:yes stop_codon:yes gene_type:complete